MVSSQALQWCRGSGSYELWCTCCHIQTKSSSSSDVQVMSLANSPHSCLFPQRIKVAICRNLDRLIKSMGLLGRWTHHQLGAVQQVLEEAVGRVWSLPQENIGLLHPQWQTRSLHRRGACWAPKIPGAVSSGIAQCETEACGDDWAWSKQCQVFCGFLPEGLLHDVKCR